MKIGKFSVIFIFLLLNSSVWTQEETEQKEETVDQEATQSTSVPEEETRKYEVHN